MHWACPRKEGVKGTGVRVRGRVRVREAPESKNPDSNYEFRTKTI